MLQSCGPFEYRPSLAFVLIVLLVVFPLIYLCGRFILLAAWLVARIMQFAFGKFMHVLYKEECDADHQVDDSMSRRTATSSSSRTRRAMNDEEREMPARTKLHPVQKGEWRKSTIGKELGNGRLPNGGTVNGGGSTSSREIAPGITVNAEQRTSGDSASANASTTGSEEEEMMQERTDREMRETPSKESTTTAGRGPRIEQFGVRVVGGHSSAKARKDNRDARNSSNATHRGSSRESTATTSCDTRQNDPSQETRAINARSESIVDDERASDRQKQSPSPTFDVPVGPQDMYLKLAPGSSNDGLHHRVPFQYAEQDSA